MSHRIPALDTTATPADPTSFTLADVVTELSQIRRELADLLRGESPGAATIMDTNGLQTSLLVKIGPGILYSLDAFNNNGSTRIIQMFDTRAEQVPPNGTMPWGPLLSLLTVTGGRLDFGKRGVRFENGLWVVTSTSVASLTIGSADMWAAVRYL